MIFQVGDMIVEYMFFSATNEVLDVGLLIEREGELLTIEWTKRKRKEKQSNKWLALQLSNERIAHYRVYG